MNAEQRLLAYNAVLQHHSAEVERGMPRKSNEKLLGGAIGALDYDLLTGHRQVFADIGSGDGNRASLATLFEPLYRFALMVTEGHLSVAESVKAANDAKTKEAAKAAAPTPAPPLPPSPGGLVNPGMPAGGGEQPTA